MGPGAPPCTRGRRLTRAALGQASNIDDVLGHHTSFLDSCLKDCMLTNPELLRVFSKLMSVCVMFTNCMQVRRDSALPALPAAVAEPGRAVF